jgi:hypothetical protein
MAEWTSRQTSEEKTGDPRLLPRAVAIGHAVRRVGSFGLTRPQCLARSVAITDMLRAEGIEGAVIHIGVRPAGAKLDAHAWVEYAGQVVGDTRDYVQGFAELARTRTAGPR